MCLLFTFFTFKLAYEENLPCLTGPEAKAFDEVNVILSGLVGLRLSFEHLAGWISIINKAGFKDVHF